MPMGLTEQLKLIELFSKTAPVKVEELSCALGIPVHRSFLPKEVSGMIERAADERYRISINANDPLTRQRFTIAHELGHYMLHRYLLGDGIDEDRAYRSIADGKYKNTKIGAAEETEANKFAAGLLMPGDLIKQYRDKGECSPEQLASHFGVSVHAMSIRLGVPYNPMRF